MFLYEVQHQSSKHLEVPKELQHSVASLSVFLGGIIPAKDDVCVSEGICQILSVVVHNK